LSRTAVLKEDPDAELKEKQGLFQEQRARTKSAAEPDTKNNCGNKTRQDYETMRQALPDMDHGER